MVTKTVVASFILFCAGCEKPRTNERSRSEDVFRWPAGCLVTRQQAVEVAENEQLKLASGGEREDNLNLLRKTFVTKVRTIADGVELKLEPREMVKGGGVIVVIDCKAGTVKKKILQ